MIRINLLPWREDLRKAKKTRFIITVISSVIFAGILVGLMHFYLHEGLVAQQDRNNYLQSQIDLQAATITTLNKKSKLQASTINELKFLFNLQQESYQAVQLMDELVRIIPEAISLTKIIRTANKVTLIGQAKSDLEITLLLQKLAKSNFFKEPNLTEISGKEVVGGEERLFQIDVEMRGKA